MLGLRIEYLFPHDDSAKLNPGNNPREAKYCRSNDLGKHITHSQFR